MARSLAYLFLAGALLGVLTLLFPHSAAIMDRELVGLAVVAAATGLALYLWADHARVWQVHVVLAFGTVMLSLAVYLVENTVIYPLLYTWAALFAFYFFRLEIALAHLALIGLCYAVVLIDLQPDSAVVRWLLAARKNGRFR